MKPLVLFLVWPDRVWPLLRTRPWPLAHLVRMALAFAIGIGVSVQVGIDVFNWHWSPQWGYNPSPIFGSATAPIAALLSLAMPFALAGIFAWLAPLCGARRDFLLSANLAVLGVLPFWVASLGLFLMADIVLCLIAAAWSVVLFMRGAAVLFDLSLDDSAQFVIGAVMAMGGLFSLLGLGLGGLMV
jgi:hypothetical protein